MGWRSLLSNAMGGLAGERSLWKIKGRCSEGKWPQDPPFRENIHSFLFRLQMIELRFSSMGKVNHRSRTRTPGRHPHLVSEIAIHSFMGWRQRRTMWSKSLPSEGTRGWGYSVWDDLQHGLWWSSQMRGSPGHCHQITVQCEVHPLAWGKALCLRSQADLLQRARQAAYRFAVEIVFWQLFFPRHRLHSHSGVTVNLPVLLQSGEQGLLPGVFRPVCVQLLRAVRRNFLH